MTDGLEPPYPPSEVITGMDVDADRAYRAQPGSDNQGFTWLEDDGQGFPFGDGGGFEGNDVVGRVMNGFARLDGTFPYYEGQNLAGGVGSPGPQAFPGKSISALDVRGELYMWRNGDASNTSAYGFAELWHSGDGGVTWEPLDVRWDEPGWFDPSFLQFGRGYRGSRDRYVYSYTTDREAEEWEVSVPGRINLVRVPRDAIDDRRAYEWFAGRDDGRPAWTDAMADREPVWEDPENGAMRTQVIYNEPLERYLLTTEHSRVDPPDGSLGNVGVFEAPEPWGPWRTVAFRRGDEDDVEPLRDDLSGKAYMWSFSVKELSHDGTRTVVSFPANDQLTVAPVTFHVEIG